MRSKKFSREPWQPYDTPEQFTADLTVPDCGRGGVFAALPCPKCGKQLSWQADSRSDSTPGLGVVGFLLAYPWTARYRCQEHGVIDERLFSKRLKAVTLLRKLLITAGGIAAAAVTVWIIRAIF